MLKKRSLTSSFSAGLIEYLLFSNQKGHGIQFLTRFIIGWTSRNPALARGCRRRRNGWLLSPV